MNILSVNLLEKQRQRTPSVTRFLYTWINYYCRNIFDHVSMSHYARDYIVGKDVMLTNLTHCMDVVN